MAKLRPNLAGIDPITIRDEVLIGMGDFVENAIIADPADSLGAIAGYTDAVGADTVNAGVTENVSTLTLAPKTGAFRDPPLR